MPRRFALGNAQDLVQAERDVRARIGDSELDFAAMAAVSNIYRAANAIRNHMEQQVLAEEDLSWAAFTVLFVLWIWGDQQTRHLAAEAGVTKGTLTGVLKTLEKRGLARRRGHDADGRLVLVSLEPKGQEVIERLFPAFNRGEAQVSARPHRRREGPARLAAPHDHPDRGGRGLGSGLSRTLITDPPGSAPRRPRPTPGRCRGRRAGAGGRPGPRRGGPARDGPSPATRASARSG